MELRIDSSSDVPLRRQLFQQIVFLITTERLKSGAALPSVREVARRLKIHHNTVSEAYQDLVNRNWLTRRRGSRLTVTARDEEIQGGTLDDLINRTITAARDMGFPLQALRNRVRERLLAEPPDHLLVVERDAELRELICSELREELSWRVEGCSLEDLAANSGLAIGALVLVVQHHARAIAPLVPKDRPAVPLRFSDADGQLARVRALKGPSVIAVISSSAVFLEVARGVLAAAVGNRHAVREILIPSEDAAAARSADLVFCDSIARRRCRLTKAIHYRLLDAESIEHAGAAMRSYQDVLQYRPGFVTNNS